MIKRLQEVHIAEQHAFFFNLVEVKNERGTQSMPNSGYQDLLLWKHHFSF